MSDLKYMKYTSKDVGSTIKSSKHQNIWEFTLDDKRFEIQYFMSKISNKRKIIYNQKVIREEECRANVYAYEFVMDGHTFKVVQTFDIADLIIDGESFEHFYNLERTRREFNKEQNPNILSMVSGDLDNIKEESIQRSNEINFIKNEKPKQILRLSFKNKSNINQENNLKKFKFSLNGNNIHNENKNDYMKNENNKNNLIDFDNDDFNKKNQMNYSNFNNNQNDINNYNLSNNSYNISYLNNNNNQNNSNNKNILNNNINLLDLNNIFNNNSSNNSSNYNKNQNSNINNNSYNINFNNQNFNNSNNYNYNYNNNYNINITNNNLGNNDNVNNEETKKYNIKMNKENQIDIDYYGF